MADLRTQTCRTFSNRDSSLNEEKISTLLSQLNPQWLLDESEQTISFTFKFKNYYQTIAFVNVVAQIAHQQDHHPDLSISYNLCKITYSTHSVAGLSINDFICADKINNIHNI